MTHRQDYESDNGPAVHPTISAIKILLIMLARLYSAKMKTFTKLRFFKFSEEVLRAFLLILILSTPNSSFYDVLINAPLVLMIGAD